MAGYPTGAFGRRKPQPPPDDVTEADMFPPSREERMQTLWMFGTITIAVLLLAVGFGLRYTVFKERYTPKPFATPSVAPIASVATLPSPTPAPSAAPKHSSALQASPKPAKPKGKEPLTIEGEPLAPSLFETGGRPQ